MRVLLQTYAFWPVWGGVQKSVEFIYRCLEKARLKPIITTSSYVIMNDQEKYFISSFKKYKKMKIKRILFLSDHFSKNAFIPVWKRCCYWVLFHLSLVQYFIFLLFYRPSIVHINFINIDANFVLRFKNFFKFKLITTCQGNDILTFDRQFDSRKKITFKALINSDVITAVSEKIAAEIRRIIGDSHRNIKIIFNGIDLSDIFPISEVLASAPKNFFIFVGHFSEKKNPLFLIRSFAMFVEKYPDHSLVMAGEGFLREEADRLIKELGLEKKIFILGRLPYEKILIYIANAKALILPSLYGEGCPNVILEAMAAGTPVIGSDTAGINEVITHGKQGLLFESNNAKSLIEMMSLIETDTKLKQRLIDTARQLIRERYDNIQIAKQYLELYQELLLKK